MNEERDILRQVRAAREDMGAADAFIRTYMPFIKAETAKFLRRPPVEGHDDELSIAMIAFHEAIQSYSQVRGAFFKYAAMLIKSRLIDYHRKEKKHGKVISLETPVGEEKKNLWRNHYRWKRSWRRVGGQRGSQGEIEELTRQMEEFGVSLTDVAENCPRQERTLRACRKALYYAKEHPEILEELLRTKRLPIARLCQGSGTERKTMERHRKYMVALLLIYTNGYEIIRGHLKQVMKGVTEK